MTPLLAVLLIKLCGNYFDCASHSMLSVLPLEEGHVHLSTPVLGNFKLWQFSVVVLCMCVSAIWVGKRTARTL